MKGKKMESKNKENIKNTYNISHFPLKILSYLRKRKRGTAFFSELTKSLDRSKSQVSVTLKKLEGDLLISKSTKKPMRITITKKGIRIHQTAIKNMSGYNLNKGSEKKLNNKRKKR